MSALKLGEMLAVAREAKGMTLRDLEKETGISNALLSQIETGKVKEPGFFKIMLIAEALNISLDRLATLHSRKRMLSMLRAKP